MKPSMWTSIIREKTPAEVLEKLAEQGWEVFELSCEHIGVLAEGGAPAVAQYARTRDRLGVEIPQCHCTITVDVASLDAQRRSNDIALVHRDIDICSELGIRNIVIHTGGNGNFQNRQELDTATALRLEAFAELDAHCERAGTYLAIENNADYGTGLWGHRRFGSIVEELLDFIAQVGSPALGICLDTSHANMMGLNQPEAIRTCGEKLIALHISDNDGSGDQHRMPGYGTVDFDGIIKALREIDFPFHFNLEIPGENAVFGNRAVPLPEGIVELRSRYALDLCTYLLS